MNKLYKTLIYNNEVSLSVLETTQLVNDAIKIHGLDDKSAKTLGELLTCGAFMAGCLKSDLGAISITVKGGEDSGAVSVSGDKDLHMRGYIDSSFEGKIHGGYLTVIKEDGLFRPFVGTCELAGNDVSQNLMQYFDKSEQVPTAVAIGAKVENGVCLAAGGVVMQLLPGTSQESMDLAEERMQAFVNIAEVMEKYGADGIMDVFFKQICEKSAVYTYFPSYKCNCSHKKIESVILSLGRDEAYKIIEEEGSIKAHCHYCNTDYEFFKEDVDKLFKL